MSATSTGLHPSWRVPCFPGKFTSSTISLPPLFYPHTPIQEPQPSHSGSQSLALSSPPPPTHPSRHVPIRGRRNAVHSDGPLRQLQSQRQAVQSARLPSIEEHRQTCATQCKCKCTKPTYRPGRETREPPGEGRTAAGPGACEPRGEGVARGPLGCFGAESGE